MFNFGGMGGESGNAAHGTTPKINCNKSENQLIK